jgi:hypothetical protein
MKHNVGLSIMVGYINLLWKEGKPISPMDKSRGFIGGFYGK